MTDVRRAKPPGDAPRSAGMPRRRFLQFGVAAGASLGVSALAGCGNAVPPPVSDAPARLGPRPASLTMLNAGTQSDAAGVTAVLPRLKDELGVTVEMDNMAYDALQSRTFAELASGHPSHDIYILDTPWTPTLTRVLEPLSSYLNSRTLNSGIDIDLTDFIPKVFYDTSVFKVDSPSLHYPDDTAPVDVHSIVSNGFEILGLPIQSNALTLAYRRDLFESPAEQRAFKARFGRDLAVPVTWDDFVQVAQFFTRPAQGMFGTTVLGGAQEGWDFCDFKTMVGSWGGDGHIITSDIGVACATPQAIAAWEFYVDLINKYRVTPANATTAGWDQAIATFSSGNSAMTWNYGPQSLSPSVHGTIGYALMPKKVQHGPHFGTWQFGIPAALPASRKAWAYRAIAWLTSAAAQIDMLPTELHATRASVFSHAKADPAITAEYGNFYSVLEDSLAVGYGRPRVTAYDQVVQPMVQSLNLAENSTASVAGQLQAAAQSTKQTLASLGYTNASVVGAHGKG
jgi:multiple sugar transport system substrate-binding protein